MKGYIKITVAQARKVNPGILLAQDKVVNVYTKDAREVVRVLAYYPNDYDYFISKSDFIRNFSVVKVVL